MRSLVELTGTTIARALAGLGEAWNPAPESEGSGPGRTGACLDFYGIVRGMEATEENPAGSPIVALEYEAHEAMARRQMELIIERLGESYPLEAMLVIHRTGLVPVGEASLLVRILSPHRGEALRACAEFLDQLKVWVPIWKHPVLAPPRRS
jgi:molybdopterin synthase catalytic subunit